MEELKPCHKGFSPAALCLRCLLEDLLDRHPGPTPSKRDCRTANQATQVRSLPFSVRFYYHHIQVLFAGSGEVYSLCKYRTRLQRVELHNVHVIGLCAEESCCGGRAGCQISSAVHASPGAK